jgi:hypothetical protein
MRLIRELFAGDIDRKIEEVIKVDQTDEEIVAQEIKEYIITEAIERSLHDVLEAYREAPNKPNEGIAAWVSGFFGSGKSSFAKYLGLAISNRPIQGVGSADRLAQQTNSARIKALLETIKVQIPTEAIIFDVSAERSIGADQSITEIFYRQLLEHLHYSNNLQVAELQIELEEQGRFDAFLSEYEQLNFKESWEEAKTRQTQALPRASAVMHKLEPQTYPNEKSWAEISRGQQVPITTAVFADRAIQLMTRHRPGTQLLFVVDARPTSHRAAAGGEGPRPGVGDGHLPGTPSGRCGRSGRQPPRVGPFAGPFPLQTHPGAVGYCRSHKQTRSGKERRG